MKDEVVPPGAVASTETQSASARANTTGIVAEAAFTPGPWTFMRNRVVSENTYDTVAGTHTGANAHWTIESQDICSANARLIAAAPDLYASLREFMEDDRFQVGVGGNPIAVEAMIARARAALSKASGAPS